jgi:hypothetical protein
MHQNSGIPHRSRKKEPQGKSETGLKRGREKEGWKRRGGKELE